MHPYIFSVLPVIQLYFQNCLEFNFWHIAGIIGIICVINAGIYHGLSFFFKKHRPVIAILVSLWWIVFWFAIPAANYFLGGVKFPSSILAYKWLIALVSSASALGSVGLFLLYFRHYCEAINKAFRIFGLIALAVVIFSGLTHFQKIENVSLLEGAIVKSNQSHPNVYHILLDAYTNYDILKEEYGYDNAAFYQALEDLGFVCFRSSHSNYLTTLLSVSSMFNFGLIHEKAYGPFLDLSRQKVLLNKINHNAVWSFFIKNKYNFHLYDQTGIYKSNHAIKNQLIANSFEGIFLLVMQNTFLRNILFGMALETYYHSHINQIKAMLMHLEQTPQVQGHTNQYSYAHILCPHTPFVFDEHGGVSKKHTLQGFIVQKQVNQAPTPEENKQFKQSYVNQVKALNKLVLPAIESILRQHESSQPPIIILHGDHGKSHSREEDPFHVLGNLFAIYVPEEWREEAKTLEFINLYRFVCNHLFGLEYPYQESQYFY